MVSHLIHFRTGLRIKVTFLPSMNEASMELKDKNILQANTITLMKQFANG